MIHRSYQRATFLLPLLALTCLSALGVPGCSCSDDGTTNRGKQPPKLSSLSVSEEEKIVEKFAAANAVEVFFEREESSGASESDGGGNLFISKCEDHEFEKLLEVAPPGMYEADRVRITSSKLTDRTMQHLAKFPNVESLFLDGTQLSDAGMVQLKNMKKLQDLSLSETRISDAGLANLVGLSKLQYLNLAGTRITDRGLEQVAQMPNLIGLTLYGTAITDLGIMHLASLRQLRSINVENTRVTAGGVKQLRESLPNLAVYPKDLVDGLPPVPPPKH